MIAVVGSLTLYVLVGIFYGAGYEAGSVINDGFKHREGQRIEDEKLHQFQKDQYESHLKKEEHEKEKRELKDQTKTVYWQPDEKIDDGSFGAYYDF